MNNKRKLILAICGGPIAAAWVKPVINVVSLPAHAMTSEVEVEPEVTPEVENPCEETTPIPSDFSYTGSVQSFVVPAGIEEITFDIRGGDGGNGFNPDAVGGNGSRITGSISVNPCDVINVIVGGAGVSASAGGGGGGSGIYNLTANQLIAVAGGGGGGSNTFRSAAQGGRSGESGGNGLNGGGSNGAGGQMGGGGPLVGVRAGGGGGVNSSGAPSGTGGGAGLPSGGSGGTSSQGNGGFGIGGGGAGVTGSAGGGGGGYSGGGGGTTGGAGGGGGGSFVHASVLNPLITAGNDVGGGTESNGSVSISTA